MNEHFIQINSADDIFIYTINEHGEEVVVVEDAVEIYRQVKRDIEIYKLGEE